MRNLLHGEVDINEQYDLKVKINDLFTFFTIKGSTIGRVVEMAEGQEPNPNVALKDLNFTRKLSFNKEKRKIFLSQLDKDTKVRTLYSQVENTVDGGKKYMRLFALGRYHVFVSSYGFAAKSLFKVFFLHIIAFIIK
jgi:hypothetical protein